MAKIIPFVKMNTRQSRQSKFDFGGKPMIGAVVGFCCDCGCDVKIRQPWLSDVEEVEDGEYQVHCTNETCINHSGMDVHYTSSNDNDFRYVDFVDWSVSLYDRGRICQIIPT